MKQILSKFHIFPINMANMAIFLVGKSQCQVFNEGMTRQQKALLMAKARERNLTAPAWKQGRSI